MRLVGVSGAPGIFAGAELEIAIIFLLDNWLEGLSSAEFSPIKCFLLFLVISGGLVSTVDATTTLPSSVVTVPTFFPIYSTSS